MILRAPPKMNSFWHETARECRNIAARMAWRYQAWSISRKLVAAERELGELGWQQADFDADDNHARELQSAEKEQARLVFEIAESKEEYEDFKKLSEAKTAVVQDQIDSDISRSGILDLRVTQLGKLLALERAQGAALYLIESEEKSLQQEQDQLDLAKTNLQTHRQQAEELKNEIRVGTERFLSLLKAMEARLGGLQEKRPIQYAMIGRELADVGIAPLNQPEALENVLFLRCQVAATRQKIRQSLALRQRLSTTSIVLAQLLCFGSLPIVLILLYRLGL